MSGATGITCEKANEEDHMTKKLTAALLSTMFAWTLAVYDRNGGLVTVQGGYPSRQACDAAGMSLQPPGGSFRCSETKTYRPGRG